MNEINVIRLIIDSSIFMLILLVQIVIYPCFHSISNELFSNWHYNYMKTISLVIGPLMIIQAIILSYQFISIRNIVSILSLISVFVVWITTVSISVPCHNALQANGYNAIIVDRLINTNWIRTISWLITLILSIFNYYKSN